jgi:uncharacterized membrane protein
MPDAAIETAQWIARVGLAIMFVSMGVMHFLPGPARTMARLIPPRLRGTGLLSPRALVYFTGLCEIAGGIGMLIPATRGAAAVGLVLFLIAVFPANAYASEHRDRFGAISIPFWRRYFAQLALILVVVLAAL